MLTLQQVREQYPQYHDMSDDDLATALHGKFYSDMPMDQFRDKVGLKPPPAPTGINAPPSDNVEAGLRATALTGRAALQGLAYLPLKAMDLGVASRNVIGNAVNKARGQEPTPDYSLPSHDFEESLDTWMPKPMTKTEKVTSFVTEALASAAGTPTVGANSAAGHFATDPATYKPMQLDPSRDMITRGKAIGLEPNAIEQNQKVAQELWATRAGMNGESKFDSSFFERAYQHLDDGTTKFADADRIVKSDPSDFRKAMSSIVDEYRGLINTKDFYNKTAKIRQNFGGVGDTLTAENAVSLIQQLRKAAANQMGKGDSKDHNLGEALFKLNDYVEDLFKGGLPEKEATAWDTLRGNWRALFQLSQPNVVRAGGELNTKRLAGILASGAKTAFTFGKDQSPAYEAIRYAKEFPQYMKQVTSPAADALTKMWDTFGNPKMAMLKYALSKAHQGIDGFSSWIKDATPDAVKNVVGSSMSNPKFQSAALVAADDAMSHSEPSNQHE